MTGSNTRPRAHGRALVQGPTVRCVVRDYITSATDRTMVELERYIAGHLQCPEAVPLRFADPWPRSERFAGEESPRASAARRSRPSKTCLVVWWAGCKPGEHPGMDDEYAPWTAEQAREHFRRLYRTVLGTPMPDTT